MLSVMRKHAGSWIIKVLIFIIAVVFVFLGVGSYRSRQATQVADINGEIISYETYRQTYVRLLDQYRRIYGSRLNDEMLKLLQPKERALDDLINRSLMSQEADRLDIRVTDEELSSAIQKIPAFLNNGVFDYERYRIILSRNNLTTEAFEDSHKEELRMDKLRTLVLNGITVSEAEARDWYDWFNAEVNLNYVFIDPKSYADITPTEEEVNDYFKAHDKDYKTEPQIKVRYLLFDPEAYKAQVKVSDEMIATYYDNHPEEFKTEKTVEARHILLKLDAQADDQTVEKRQAEAMEIFQKAKSGADFAELAKQYSEGPTKDSGGDLGAFTRETMVKPFADQAFAMQAGEISEPVRTQFGWHIIKVEKVNEASTQSLASATEEIRSNLVKEAADELALEQAETIYDSVFDGDDLTAVASTYEVPVHTTELFTPAGPRQTDIPDPKKFADTAFGLEKLAISEIQEIEKEYYLMQVIDLVEAAIPSYETVVEVVKADVLKNKQDQQAQADAEAFLADMQKGETMAAVGKKSDLKPQATGFFKRNASIPKIGYEPQIIEAAFQLSKEKPVADQAFKGKQGWYVIQLDERKSPGAEDFANEQEAIQTRLVEQKKQTTFQRWLDDLKAHSKIDINRELIE